LEHVQIHDTGNGRLHEVEGVIHCYVHQTCSVFLHYDSSKRCVCPLYKLVYSFNIVNIFLKHTVYSYVKLYTDFTFSYTYQTVVMVKKFI
jgi:hypothetical protein